MDVMTTAILGFSALGGFIISLLGGADLLLYTLVLFIIIDVCLGIIVSAWYHHSPKTLTGRFSSKEFYKGLNHKFLMFVVIIIAVALDNLLQTYILVGDVQTTLLRSVVILFYIFMEASSILENLALLDMPLPAKLMDALEVLKSTNDYKEYRMEQKVEGVVRPTPENLENDKKDDEDS